MNINSNFAHPAEVMAEDNSWLPSPSKGVYRKMLDRIGGEVARATSLVTYSPNSSFSEHTHSGGEEFFVLDGVFQDEHGAYEAGSYVRNPPTSKHTPRSDKGCTIFVKLWQFSKDDRKHVNINTLNQPFKAKIPGVSEKQIFKDNRENVRIEKWEPVTAINISSHKGLEILVLRGRFIFGSKVYSKHSWLRLPVGHNFNALAGIEGTEVLIKTDHLSGPIYIPGERK